MKKQRDTYQSVRDERQYGPYWYSFLWKIIRPILVAAGALLVVGGIVYSVWNAVYDEYLAPANAADHTPMSFTVESGQSLTRVANNLETAGLIRNRTVFKYYCDFAGLGQKIQAGSYTLNPAMSMGDIAEQLTMGDGNPIVRDITLIPGWTLEEFAAYLVEEGAIANAEDFLELCRTGERFSDYTYVADVQESANVEKRKYVLEGYLSPNTYEVYLTATPEDIIRRLLSQPDRAFPVEYQERAAALGMTMDEVITLASIIEKEAQNEDFAKTSAVFHNRIEEGMKLQSDVTIHYVTGLRKMSLTNSDLSLNSPYNTYQVTGLPLGPICNPSEEAIHAALYPDETFLAENYLYFCAKDPASGELHFSRTLQEHEQAVDIYAPLWRDYDAERGIQ